MKGSFREDLCLLLSQVVARIKEVLEHLNYYRIHCKKNKIIQSEKACSFIYNQLALTISLLKDIQSILENNRLGMNSLMKAEIEIRTAIQSIVFIQLALSWRSPVSSQSLIPQFFNLEDQGSTRILYERWGHKEVNRIETQLLKIFGLSEETFSCTVVNSGMAALSLVESFFIRNLLNPGDSIIIAPYVYFEFRLQLKSIKWLNIIESTSYDHEELIKIIEANDTKAIFLDVLTNTAEQRMVDVGLLLDYFKDHRYCPAIVIDGTMLPCAATAYIRSFPQKERIFYIESCSKYLQLGLDMSIAGVLVCDAQFKPQMDSLRNSMGSVLTEHNAYLFPLYRQSQLINKISRIESNACFIAHELSHDTEFIKRCHVIYPGLSDHPDYSLAKKIDRYGGCVVFQFKVEWKDVLKKMKQLIEIIIQNARVNHIPIAQGLSFGFSFPRITTDVPARINKEPTDERISYLRLYVGDQSQLNKSLVKLIRVSFEQYEF